MKKSLIIIIVLLVVIVGGYVVYDQVLDKEEQNNKPCDSINTNVPELSFEMNYCSGAYCTANTEEGCVAIDVVNEVLESDQDGKSDCEWRGNNCIPNK